MIFVIHLDARHVAFDAMLYLLDRDQVDNHRATLFKAAILSTLLSVGSEAGTSDSENSLVQAIRQGDPKLQSGWRAGGRPITEREPTIAIRPSPPVRVLVIHDLALGPMG